MPYPWKGVIKEAAGLHCPEIKGRIINNEEKVAL